MSAEEKKLPIRIREANQEDVAFIFNSWLKSYRQSLFARNITNTIYFDQHHKVLENLLKTNKVIIACNEKDPSQMYGYICAGKEDGIFVLHYIYVKHTYRNLGIGKELLNSFDHDINTAAVYTHHTRIAEKLAAKYNLLFHPYLLFNTEVKEDKNESEQK